VLFQEVNLGVNTFEELAQNIGDTAPCRGRARIPFSQVSAALATDHPHGTTWPRPRRRSSRLISLIKPTKGMTELHSMGFENGQAAISRSASPASCSSRRTPTATSRLPTGRATSAPSAGSSDLTGKNLETYTKLVRQMGSATAGVGATQAAFAEQAKSISFQWQRAKASLTPRPSRSASCSSPRSSRAPRASPISPRRSSSTCRRSRA
jgi:hypothetical protein